MIGKLRGRIDTIGEDHVIVDVGGVGYIAFCSSRTLLSLPPAGDSAELVIETHVREDHIHLYGFLLTAERDWFRLLTTVQGVGARMALNILGILSPEQLVTTIAARDTKPLTAASGVGKKLAERIVTELKSKVEKMAALPTGGDITLAKNTSASSTTTPSSVSEEAISALVHLGYTRSDAYSAIAMAAQKHDGAKLEDLITHGLKELAR